ncbi:hypothetical protein ACFLXT_02720 [Chloroflexota bacterium]
MAGDMKKRFIIIVCLLLAIVLSSSIALASDITGALFKANINIFNSGSAATNVATTFTANATSLIDAEYLNATANNCAMLSSAGADVRFMPGYAGNQWCTFTPSIGASAVQTDILYMGDGVSGGEIKYFPGDAGMVIGDDAGLEGTDNFTWELGNFWFNSSCNTSDNDTAVYVVSYNVTDASATWYNETFANDNITTTYAWIDIPLTTVSDYLTFGVAGTHTRYIRYYLDREGVDINTYDIDVYYNGAWHVVHNAAWEDSLTWIEKDLGAYYTVTQLRIRFTNASVGAAQWVRVHEFLFGHDGGILIYRPANFMVLSSGDNITAAIVDGAVVSVGGVTDAEHSANITANTTSLGLYIDGVLEDTTAMIGNLKATNDNWTVARKYGMPYLEYTRVFVGGNLLSDLPWQYDSTFTDLSGNSNDGYPTFRTGTSNALVTANITSFSPVSIALAPAFTVSDAPLLITGNITVTGNFTSGNVTGADFPGAAVVEDAATAGGTPNIWVWGILAIFTLAMAGFGISWFERAYGAGGGGSLLVRMFAHITIMGLLVTFGRFDWWMLIFYIVIAGALAMMSQHRGVMGSPTQYGLVGFLAMCWIGLTLINRVLVGEFITANETAWANYFAFTQKMEILGFFSMPVINFDFFTQGIPSLLKWDYSVFGGNAQLIQYMLYSINAVVGFMIFMTIIGILYNAFRVR